MAVVRGAVVAAVGSAEGIDEHRGAEGSKGVVVAVGGICALFYLGQAGDAVVDCNKLFYKGLAKGVGGVDYGDALAASAEHVEVYEEFHLGVVDKRVSRRMGGAAQSGLFAAEEHKHQCVAMGISG